MFVKVCGLRNIDQANWAIEFGYDAIGVVVCKKSKRHCDEEIAKSIAEYAKGKVETFVVGLTLDDVKSVMGYFDTVQLYEQVELDKLAFASKYPPNRDLNYKYFFYDASIGAGTYSEFPDWLSSLSGKVVLAGGLNSQNIESVIKKYSPFGVDVSSGVETSGIKDREKMRRFIEAVRRCE
ncbi:MAG: hypothetical protein AB2551_08075 [Candidatus Thiodiazotropha sp.]